jgi:hypothetical protein
VDDGRTAGLAPGLRNRCISAYGDAVLPQVTQAIGRAILNAELSLSDLGTPSLNPGKNIAGEASDVDPIAFHNSNSFRRDPYDGAVVRCPKSAVRTHI